MAKQLVGKWQSNNQSTAVITCNNVQSLNDYAVVYVKLDVAVVDPWPINRTSTESQENNAAAAKPAQDKNVIMLYIKLAIHSVHASSSQLLKSFEVDSSHMPLSSQVKWSRMWSSRRWSTIVVILASSRVTFLYRSDTQVYLQSVSAYTVSGVPMLSTNGQRCKRRLKTAHWAGILAPLFFEWRVWNHCCFRRQGCGTGN